MSIVSSAQSTDAKRQERYIAEEKDALRKQGDAAQLKRLLKYLKPRRKQVFFAIVLSMLTALMLPLPMVIFKYTIDLYIVPGVVTGLWIMAGALLLSQILVFFLEQYSQYMIAKIGQFTMKDLREEIMDHIQAQPLRFFDKNPVGRLITRVTSDVNVLNELFTQGVVGLFQQVFSLVVILCVLFYFNWYLTLWVLIVIPFILIASRNFRNNVYTSYRLTRVRLSRLNTFMQENITGMKTVQANTREEDQYRLFDQLNASHRDAHIQTVFQYALFFPIVEVLAAIGFALVLWQGGILYLEADEVTAAVTLGQIGLFIAALDRFFTPIKDLSEKYNLIQSAIAASERLFVLLDTKPEITDREDAEPLGPMTTEIRFEDVWFAYNKEEWVLKGVSFTIKRGDTIAIVGPTGSGKTTIISLLARFYEPQRGRITIDGVDIRDLPQQNLRSRLAIVLQDVFLFSGTVAENIRLGDDRITDERIRRVAEETGFSRIVDKMPAGFNSAVMERGATLSTGQKQLLSFTRALAFDPEILLLDEATANIDTESEIQLQRAVDVLCAGRTSVIIAHRLSTIEKADRILVIHKGHLAEEGTHGELLLKAGLYKRLYDLQYKEPGVASVKDQSSESV